MVLQAVVGAPCGCPVTWPAINAIIITNRPCIFFKKNLNRLSNVLEDAATETPKVAWNTTPVTQLDLSIYISLIQDRESEKQLDGLFLQSQWTLDWTLDAITVDTVKKSTKWNVTQIPNHNNIADEKVDPHSSFPQTNERRWAANRNFQNNI